jgi:hypothetical protein
MINITIAECTPIFNRLFYEYMRIQTFNWVKGLILVETIFQAEKSDLICNLPWIDYN